MEQNATKVIRNTAQWAPHGAHKGPPEAHQGANSCRPCASHKARSHTIGQDQVGEVLHQLPADALGHLHGPRRYCLATDFALNIPGLAA